MTKSRKYVRYLTQTQVNDLEQDTPIWVRYLGHPCEYEAYIAIDPYGTRYAASGLSPVDITNFMNPLLDVGLEHRTTNVRLRVEREAA